MKPNFGFKNKEASIEVDFSFLFGKNSHIYIL